MTRFECSAGSGKTTASKIISALLYGEPQHKKATDAANYTDGFQNPLIVLDNIEVKQMTEDLSPLFIEQIHSINDTSQEMARESNPIATALASLFNAYGNAVELDEKTR